MVVINKGGTIFTLARPILTVLFPAVISYACVSIAIPTDPNQTRISGEIHNALSDCGLMGSRSTSTHITDKSFSARTVFIKTFIRRMFQ
jgi:hypothetical protein